MLRPLLIAVCLSRTENCAIRVPTTYHLVRELRKPTSQLPKRLTHKHFLKIKALGRQFHGNARMRSRLRSHNSVTRSSRRFRWEPDELRIALLHYGVTHRGKQNIYPLNEPCRIDRGGWITTQRIRRMNIFHRRGYFTGGIFTEPKIILFFFSTGELPQCPR